MAEDLRLFVDFWNFQLSWNERSGKQHLDWVKFPQVVANDVVRLFGAQEFKNHGTKVYASIDMVTWHNLGHELAKRCWAAIEMDSLLNSLDDGTFLKLRKSGRLPIAYGQLFSMGNIRIFEKLAKRHEQMSQQQRQFQAEEKVDVRSIFGEDALNQIRLNLKE